MKPTDFGKALGVAVLILVLDLGCAFASVWLWSLLIDPGHPTSYYVAAAPMISMFSTRVAGPALFALFVSLLSRRRPDRNPFLFAAVVFGLYVVLDGATIAFQSFFSSVVLVTMALKLAGAMLGAGLARAQRPRSVERP